MQHDQQAGDDDAFEDDDELDDDDDDDTGESEGEMGGDEGPDYTITIEYDDFVTRLDLDEILRTIDRIIETELLFYFFGPDLFRLRLNYPDLPPYWDTGEPEFSYVGIRSVESGSITLVAFVGGAVLGYVAKRFKRGVDKSILAEELARSGRLSGDFFGQLLARINDWGEKYVRKQRDFGGNVRRIRVEKRHKKGGRGGERA